MKSNEFKSIIFSDWTPEACWERYYRARLQNGFDREHFPEVERFWIYAKPMYTLVLIYTHDCCPNM